MTVVIEGKMEIQFFHADMTPDGEPLTLIAGQSGLSDCLSVRTRRAAARPTHSFI